jgi:uncharacterized protein (DUF427 family)
MPTVCWRRRKSLPPPSDHDCKLTREFPRHPPTYYIPQKDVQMDMMSKTNKGSFCEVRPTSSLHHYPPL